MEDKKINDGGAAFPLSVAIPPEGDTYDSSDSGQPGLSIRDYFAAHCPFTITDAHELWEFQKKRDATGEQIINFWVQIRFCYADAMLKERKL